MVSKIAVIAIALVALHSASAAKRKDPKHFVVRTVPSNTEVNEDDTFERADANAYLPPSSPSPYAPATPSTPAPYQVPPVSPYQSSASSSACNIDYECQKLDANAACINNMCQCKAKFIGINMPVMPLSTDMLSKRSSHLSNRYASQISINAATNQVVCVPAFQLPQKMYSCFIERMCCLSAAEQAAAANNSDCTVAADTAALAKIFGMAPVPSVMYKLATGTPAGISIDAATGKITLDKSFKKAIVTVTVQATLATTPAQVASATVTIIQDQGSQCCDQAPLQLVRNITKSFEIIAADFGLIDKTSFQTPALEVLLDASGTNVAADGVSLQHLFSSPCGKNLTVNSVALQPSMAMPTAAAIDICQYLNTPTAANGFQLTFRSDPADATMLIPALADIYRNAPAAGQTLSCSFNLNVTSCNGVSSLGTFTYNFPIAPIPV